MDCLECGAVLQPRSKPRCGTPPAFCSDECRRARKRKTYQLWLANNRERKLALDAKCRQKFNKDNPDYFKKYYANKREKRKAAANQWYHENAERALKRQQKYVEANRDKARRWGRKAANTRLAIKKRVFVEVVDPQVVFERDNGVCGICRKAVEMTSNWEIDHIMPMSKGGAHSYANVQLSHRKCNRAKAAKVPKGQPTLFQVVA